MPTQRAVFIHNPAARGVPSRQRLEATIASVRPEHPLDATIVSSDAPQHGAQLAAEAETAGADLIFACGGDGTLHDVINGLTRRDLPVGLIPGGTANVWAKEAKIPRNPERALRAQLGGRALQLDVGRAGARRFLLMASLGLDAAAVASVSARLKRHTGPLAYAWSGLRVGLRYPGFRVSVAFDDEAAIDIEANLIVLGNVRNYGGITEMSPQASAVDGMLDCVTFRGRGPWPTTRMLLPVLLKRHLQSSRVLFRRARRVTISGDQPAMQLDGEAVAQPEREFQIEAGAVRMLVPHPERAVFQTTG